MTRRLVTVATVTAVLLGLAPAADALLPDGRSVESSSTSSRTWLCGGVEPLTGICLDSPFETLPPLPSL